MITLGNKGQEVSQLQKYLSLLGYDLIIDGNFGNRTLRSLKAFQKKFGLTVDGVARQKVISALRAAQKRTSKDDKVNAHAKKYLDLNVDTNYNQSTEQFIKQISAKDKIFIHHTSSGSDAKSVMNYWDKNAERVSSSFIISGRGIEDGKIYEAFNPDYWSYHLGIKGSKGRLDKSSIGIELCTWGKLELKGGKFINIYGEEIPSDEVYNLEIPWREGYYYHSYSNKQLESLENLLIWIIKEYKIKVQDLIFTEDWVEYNEELITSGAPGIWTHSNVRKDRNDLYPDKRLLEVLNRIRNKINVSND